MNTESQVELPTFSYWDLVPSNLKTKTALTREGYKVGGPVRGRCEYLAHDADRGYDLFDVNEATKAPGRIKMEAMGLSEVDQHLWAVVPRSYFTQILEGQWRVAYTTNHYAFQGVIAFQEHWSFARGAVLNSSLCEGNAYRIHGVDFTVMTDQGHLRDVLFTLPLFTLETARYLYYGLRLLGIDKEGRRKDLGELPTYSLPIPGLEGYDVSRSSKYDREEKCYIRTDRLIRVEGELERHVVATETVKDKGM